MQYRIDTPAGRRKLPADREPYYSQVGSGAYVGVRVLANGTQTWIARARDAVAKKYVYLALGSLLEADEAGRYDAAAELARNHAVRVAGGVVKLEAGTVGDAMARRVAFIRQDQRPKAADEAERMFAYNVLSHPIAARALDRLTVEEFRAWLHGLVNSRLPDDYDPDDYDAPEILRRTRSTANRIIGVVRAALNQAYTDGRVDSDRAWRSEGKFEKVDGTRKTLLTAAQVETLIKAAEPDMAVFLKGLWLTAFRVGELARLRVRDFVPETRTVEIKLSKTGPRTVHLPADALALFKVQCKGKTPAAPIFARTDGSAWESANYWRPAFRAAVDASGLTERDDEPLVPYHVRHASISHLLAQGVNITGVSEMAGTSLDMLNRTYAKNVAAVTNAQIAKARKTRTI
ncbi:tyrosine-type recombinase/integrase [Cupriavidus sp. AcVe19-1a]|uniref:tyrosine-type recombinase/integrase n=1 Tax=Cupriavidus sp. AcVe19-1a TaxID=2821359 RepID=UPI001AE14E41|nr:tyrosine-type recombinase/integrase [Cupriavidus sp. AcVe19-1a]MBP0627741.1 tyrosine-type recombinase/integrase [Cupriavidus sp. AcVe19-1a]